MSWFELIARTEYAADVQAATARRLGIHRRELSDADKAELDRLANRARATGVSAEEVAEQYARSAGCRR